MWSRRALRARTKWAREHFLQVDDWPGRAGVVKERVEVRLFWRVPRVRLAYVEILGERENQNNHARVHWSLSRARCWSLAMPWLIDRRIDDV